MVCGGPSLFENEGNEGGSSILLKITFAKIIKKHVHLDCQFECNGLETSKKMHCLLSTLYYSSTRD